MQYDEDEDFELELEEEAPEEEEEPKGDSADTRREYVLTAPLIQGGDLKESGSVVRLNAQQAEKFADIITPV